MSSPRSVQELTRVSVQDSETDLQLNQYKNLNLIYFIQHQGYKNKINFLLAFLRNVFSLKYLSFIQIAEQQHKPIFFCFKTIHTNAQRCSSIKISRFCSRSNKKIFFQKFLSPSPKCNGQRGRELKISPHFHVDSLLTLLLCILN